MENKLIFISVEIDELKSLIKNAVASSIKEERSIAMKIKKDPVLLSRKKVMTIFQISAVTLRKWTKDGLIPKPIRKGRRIYFLKEDIYKMINNKINEDQVL